MFYAKSFISVSSVCTGYRCGLSADNRDSNAQYRHGAKHKSQHTDHNPDIAQHNDNTAGRYNHNSGDYKHANHTIYFDYYDFAGIKHNGNSVSHPRHAEHSGQPRQRNRWNVRHAIAKSNANNSDCGIASTMHPDE